MRNLNEIIELLIIIPKEMEIFINETSGIIKQEVIKEEPHETIIFPEETHEDSFKTQQNPHKDNKPSQEKKYECKICSRKFIRRYNYKEHLLIHAGEKRYNCRVCSKSFLTNGRLARHSKITPALNTISVKSA